MNDSDWRMRLYVLFLKACLLAAAAMVLWLVVATVKTAVAAHVNSLNDFFGRYPPAPEPIQAQPAVMPAMACRHWA